MSARHLVLEYLSGPLDGVQVGLSATTEWRRSGTSGLACPWDPVLGNPQARFFDYQGRWHVEGCGAERATHLYRDGDKLVTDPVPLAAGDRLRAASTWLIVRDIAE